MQLGVRILSIGDIGPLDGMLHVGDEAMFEAMVLELRARGASSFIGLSSNLSDSASRYNIETIPNFGFTRDDRARASEIIAGRIPGGDAAAHTIAAALVDVDLVVIAGGGNMTSIWPSHIFERSALAALAAAAGVPVVISGQTLGPQLDADDALMLSALLETADLVGVRERDSLRLADTLGTWAELNPDDASFVADLHPSTAPLPPFPYCLVTLAGHTGDTDRGRFVDSMAELLDDVALTSGLGIVFSGHFAPFSGEPRGDEVMHELVRSAMEQPSGVARVRDTAESAALARGASLVVSSRYHPVVFAVSGGVPAIGIPVDDYTTTKLTGALGNFGQDSVVPVASLTSGDGIAVARQVWRQHGSIREAGLLRASSQRATATAWWDKVAALARKAV